MGQKLLIEDDKGMLAPNKVLSYTTMGNLLTTFKDEVQLKKLEEMLEYIKMEVEKSRDKIRRLDNETVELRKKFKE